MKPQPKPPAILPETCTRLVQEIAAIIDGASQGNPEDRASRVLRDYLVSNGWRPPTNEN